MTAITQEFCELYWTSPGGNSPQNSSCTANYHLSRKLSNTVHCWRSKEELISDILLWTPAHRRTKVGRPVRTYLQQLCNDTGCSLEDLPGAMNDRDGWRERVKRTRDNMMIMIHYTFHWLLSKQTFLSLQQLEYRNSMANANHNSFLCGNGTQRLKLMDIHFCKSLYFPILEYLDNNFPHLTDLGVLNLTPRIIRGETRLFV